MQENMDVNRDQNEKIVSSAENSLFTTFTKDIAEKVSVSPKYIEEQAEPDDVEPPHMFYYYTATRNVPYTGRRTYVMSKDFKPAAGRITLTSVLVRGILNEISCADKAEIKTVPQTEKCNIKFYNIVLRNRRRQYLSQYDILVGTTADGRLMTDEECHKIINLPVKEFIAEEKRNPYWLKTTDGSSRDLLETRIQRDLKERYVNDYTQKFDADVDLIKIKASRQKSTLEQKLSEVRQEVKKIRETFSNASDRLSELRIQKQLNVAEKELKRKEEGLFLDQARIDVAAKDEIDLIRGIEGIEFDLYQIFEANFS